MKIGCFPSLVMVEFPVLFGSKVLLAQNHHFGWFPSFFYGLQCSLAPTYFPLKIKWEVSHFYGSQCCLAQKCSLFQNYHFGWFPSLVTVSSVVWLPSAFCSKMNILRSSFHLLWFPVLFWLQCVFHSKSTFLVVPFTFHGSKCCLAPKCSLLNLFELLNLNCCLLFGQYWTWNRNFESFGRQKCLLFIHIFKSDSET